MKIEKSIRDYYVNLRDVYNMIAVDVEILVKEACEKNRWLYTSRIKEMESFALKLATGREVDDFFGSLIVVPTLGDVPLAVKLVSSCLQVIDRRPKEIISSRPTEFQFDSLRLYCTLKDSVNPSPKNGLKFEVQIKTLLEQAWSQATHDFSYKGEDISWAKERIAAQLKAMLDNVELSISQISLLSMSPNLDRKNNEYEDRSQVLAFLREEIGNKSGVMLPSDLRRLTDIVYNLLKFMDSKLEDLQRWIKDETREGRGTLITDLSAYSIILQSAMNQNPNGFNSGLNRSKGTLKVFITNEVTIPASIKLEGNRRVVRLQ